MKLQGGEKVKLNGFIYLLQVVKNILSASTLILKGSTMRSTKEKMTINKVDINMALDTIKGRNKCKMSYLKRKSYYPKGFSPQDINSNLQE